MTASETGEMLNRVYVDVLEGQEYQVRTAGLLFIDPALKPKVKALCLHFILHCEKELEAFEDKYRSEFLRRPLGRYDFIPCEAPADWLRPNLRQSQNPNS
jgi:hypothetical protein